MRFQKEDLYKAGFLKTLEDYYVEKFKTDVFLKGLQDRIDQVLIRGQKAQIGPYVMMTYEIAGRVLITLQKGQLGGSDYAQISMITVDKAAYKDKYGLGIQSIDGEWAEITGMMDYVIAKFRIEMLAPDREVSIL